jgi:putative transposase
LRSLKSRGLSGVELVVSDEQEGIRAAVARHFQGASHQRCQVHYMRNLLGMVGANKRKELGAELRGIFAAPERRSALGLASSVAQKWREKGHEKIACHIEEHIEECLRAACPSRKLTAGASAPPTAWRGSTRS